MLPLKYRLKKEKDIQRVLKKGKSFSSSFLFLKVYPVRSWPARSNGLYPRQPRTSRFCFAVGLKISKKTTVRNLIKRRLRQAVRQQLAKIKPGYDVVVLARPEIKEKRYQDIKKVMDQLLGKAKLI